MLPKYALLGIMSTLMPWRYPIRSVVCDKKTLACTVQLRDSKGRARVTLVTGQRFNPTFTGGGFVFASQIKVESVTYRGKTVLAQWD